MIVDGAWYVDGQRTLETDSIEKLGSQRGGAGFGWLGLRMPTDGELDQATKAFDLPALVVEDVRRKHDRPKVERHDDCLLTVVPTARYVDDREEVEFGELFLIAGRDYLLTVRYGHAAPLGDVRAHLEAQPEVLTHGSGAVLQAALHHVVLSYVPVVGGLEHDVREVERDVFSDKRSQPTKRIYFLIRETLDFLVALEPMAAAVKRLTSLECSLWVHRDIVPLFRDVDDELSEIVERTRSIHQLLNNALAASLTQASVRQNDDMRQISAWVAIGVLPTVVGGFFGMNLGGIPQHETGFLAVTLLTLVGCLVLYRRFKAAHWL